jgi:hypothetical protein
MSLAAPGGLHEEPANQGGSHRAFDRGELDLLPYLEPRFRAELAHASPSVLLALLRRVTGVH